MLITENIPFVCTACDLLQGPVPATSPCVYRPSHFHSNKDDLHGNKNRSLRLVARISCRRGNGDELDSCKHLGQLHLFILYYFIFISVSYSKNIFTSCLYGKILGTLKCQAAKPNNSVITLTSKMTWAVFFTSECFSNLRAGPPPFSLSSSPFPPKKKKPDRR